MRLEPGNGGLPRLRVSHARTGTAEVYLHGAHVAAWQPLGQSPVLWISRESQFAPDKPIRGGVPICFPWFGAKAGEPTAPMHGFARLRDWSLLEVTDRGDDIVLRFRLTVGETGALSWTQPLVADYGVTIGSSLQLSLDVHNTGSRPLTFESALHTYFAVSNVREVAIAGLEGVEYLDKVAGMARRRQDDAPIRFAGETDRVYLDTTGPCVLDDPGRHRRIRIEKTGSRATVVWNPWIDKARAMPDFGDLEWPEMVCVETCNVGPAAVTLAPGASHVMAAAITAAALEG